MQDNNPRYIEANPRARTLAIVVGVLALIGAVVVHLAVERSGLGEAAGEQALRDAIDRLRVVLFIVVGVGLVVASMASWYFTRLGLRVLRSGEFPPPDTVLVRRTRVRGGGEARRMALMAFVLAVFVWLPVALSLWIVAVVAELVG